MSKRAWPPWLHWLASLPVLALAAWLLWRQLRELSFEQLWSAMQALSPNALLVCLACTTVSFACLAAYERMATQWLAPGKIPRATAWRVGLEAHALANTLGFHAITAIALRMKTYRGHGVDAGTIAKIAATIGGCVATGAVSVVVLALAWSQVLAGRAWLVAAAALALVAGVVVFHVRTREFYRDSPVLSHAGILVLVGLVEMGAAVAAFEVLVPHAALPGGPTLILLFIGAMLLGIISHSPGGLGVFEATILSAAPPADHAGVLVALLAYRTMYNLLPCALALVAVGVGWARGRHREPRPSSNADSGP